MSKKQERDLKDVLGNLGFVLEVFRVLVNALLDAGGTVQHLKRLLNEPDLVQHVVRMLMDPVSSPANPYKVHITYAPLPSLVDLEKQFDRVSSLFEHGEWEEHTSCIGADKAPGEKEFWVRSFGPTIDDSDNVIALADKDGYRPATLQEAVEFARAYPELQKQFCIVVLGSFTLNIGDLWSVVVLCKDGKGRRLDLSGFHIKWGTNTRFLLVRK